MIHIGICDDDAVMRKRMEQMVEKCCEETGSICKNSIFDNSGALLNEIKDRTYFDLFLLDIEMPKMDGIDLAGKIRKYLPDSLIIFVSSYEKYVYESFKVQPHRFVPKSEIDKMLQAAVRDALKQIADQEGKCLVIENKRVLERVPMKHIAYIWHRGKYAYIEKTDGSVAKVRKTLKQVYSELPDGDFVWADRGYILNISKIVRITGEEILLTNDARIDVNKDRLTDLRNQLRKYWVEKEGL